MRVSVLALTVFLAAVRSAVAEQALQSDTAASAPPADLAGAVERAHAVMWSKFIREDGLIHDYVGELPAPEDCALGRPNAIGWWSPIENGPMFTGSYLAAICERARRSGAAGDRDEARRLAKGLLACASVSDVPGFIARGMGTDRKCHYPMGSQDQTHPWFYGLHAYATSGIPDAGERKIVVDKMKATGWITGSLAQRGTYHVMLRAENCLGHAERELRIVVGDELLLTPPLGCNTWGGWGPRVTDANLRAAAQAMVDSGLIQHGWQYVNIDDGWQGQCGGPHHAIQPNEKFGDMRGLCDYIHRLGLKAGIYSTPWTTSYAGFVGGSSDDPHAAWQRPNTLRDGWHHGKHFFEAQDARQWAEWGFDYVKYDWGVDSVEITRRMARAQNVVPPE